VNGDKYVSGSFEVLHVPFGWPRIICWTGRVIWHGGRDKYTQNWSEIRKWRKRIRGKLRHRWMILKWILKRVYVHWEWDSWSSGLLFSREGMCYMEMGKDAFRSSTNPFKMLNSNLCWFIVNVDILSVTWCQYWQGSSRGTYGLFLQDLCDLLWQKIKENLKSKRCLLHVHQVATHNFLFSSLRTKVNPLCIKKMQFVPGSKHTL
jgi:hypothetical protein